MADEGSSEDEDYDPTRQDEEDLVEKPAKRSRHRFIDDTAEVEDEEDEDDEDEDEEDEEGGDGNDEGDNELFDDKAVERENRRLDAERRKAEEERLEDEVRKRYERADEFYEDEDYGDDTRFTELPDAQRDPKLWLIKCKPGQERDLIIRLMQKYLDSAQTDQPLSIKSALCTEIKGYIYVEAYKEAHVREATQGMNGLFYRITQVPAREMTDVMRVRSAEKKALVPGAWVRMRRNDIYKDDLAQVLDLDVDGTRARVRLVPRLRLSDEDEESKRRVRPPPKLFDVEDMRAKGEDVGSVQRGARGRAVHFFENQEFEDGFLIRHLSVKGLKWENVTPTLAELERFKSALGATAEADLLAAHQKLSSTDFRAGDAVKVVDGDLKHLVGSVTQVSSDGTTVTILPDHAKLRASGPIALSAELLAKYFKMGDHVKVIGGSHHLGETGMVVRVGSSTESEAAGAKGRNAANATVLHILTDLSQQEIIVRAAHVQECAEVSAGLEQLGVYSLYDLVDVASIGAPVVGVVVKVEHSAFKVLTTHNVVESVDVGAMGRKRTSRNAVALDSANARIEIGTRVADLATNAEGTVKHIFKSFLFIHNHETRVNAGISCVRARQVRVVSGKSGGPQYQGYDSADAAACDAAMVARNASYASLLVPQSPSQLQADGSTPNGMLGGGYGGGTADGFGGAGGFAGGFGGGGSLDGGKGYGKGGGKGGDGRGGRGRGRGGVDSDVGRRMQVTRGSFKGYYGTVKAVTGNTARLELEGKEKIISVAKANLRKAEDKRAGAGGGHSCGMGAAAGFGVGGFGGARPVWNDFDGSRTPTHLGACATPLRNDGFRTPMHDQDWGRTPLHDSFAPMTPMHDAGSRTPLHGSIWDPMAPTTPLHRPSTPSYGTSTTRPAEDSFEQQWAAMGGGGGGGAPDALSSSSASFMSGLGGGAGLGESPFAGGASNLFGSGSGSISGNSSWAAGSSAADASGFGSLSGGGGGGGASGGAAELLPERVLVTLSVPGAEGKRGVIAEVRPDGEYEVSLVDEVRTVRATGAQLEVVRPSKRDSVIILRGDNKGLSGQLIGIDNEDGIVKMTLPGGGTDIKIIDLDSCAATG